MKVIPFHQLYHDFMTDYRDTGHMEVCSEKVEIESCYFLPHHGVLKKYTTTPKLRTVFNGSAKDKNGFSINDKLHRGPNLLPDLSELILGWMKYKFVFVSDIRQMFRQILINKGDRKYQLILWRFDVNKDIDLWYLNTVTYGMICGPYLAIRVLHQLDKDEGSNYPLGAYILEKETYMDDTISYAHSLADALDKKSELIKICKVGSFSLHKWLANHPSLLDDLRESSGLELKDTNVFFSLLGLKWNPVDDYFAFDISVESLQDKITKRIVLSSIFKLYDPLGWIAPVIVTGKILMQKLWLLKLDWDQPLSPSLQTEFLNWYSTLNLLNNIKIKRWLGFVPNARYELHGFSDASKKAISAVIYLKTISENDCEINLVQAKTKVAPHGAPQKI